MANSSLTIIHVNRELLAAMPITKECSPVYNWDNEARTFTDTQSTDDNGVPVWETEALLPVGWGRTTTPIKLRIASAKKPDVKPDPMKLMAILTGETPATSAAPASSAPARPASRSLECL